MAAWSSSRRPGIRQRPLWNADAHRRPRFVAGQLRADVVAAGVSPGRGLESPCGARPALRGRGVTTAVVDLRGCAGSPIDPSEEEEGAAWGPDLDLVDATQEHGWGCRPGVGHRASRSPRRRMGWRHAGRKAATTLSRRGRRRRRADPPSLGETNRTCSGRSAAAAGNSGRHRVKYGCTKWTEDPVRDPSGRRAGPRGSGIREADRLPRSCNTSLQRRRPPAPFAPRSTTQGGFALVLCGSGTLKTTRRAVDRMRAALPPLVEAVKPMPYTAEQAFDQPTGVSTTTRRPRGTPADR